MLHFTRIVACGLLAVVLAIGPVHAQDPEEQALEVTRTLLHDAHHALVETRDQAALRSAIEQAFDFEVWERFLIGDRIDRFAEAERDEFRGLLPGFMAYLYNDQFDKGLDQPPAIDGVRKVRRDYLVAARFKRASGNDLPVEWRLRTKPEGAQVIDVMVGGTSFLLLKREEFHAIIDKDGVSALLEHMRTKSL